jgi:hypothetical protein
VYVTVSPQAVGRIHGRQAGAWTEATYDDLPIEAAIVNLRGNAAPDGVAAATERALRQTNPEVTIVGRFPSTMRSTKAALNTILKRYPDVRVIIGPHAGRAAEDILKQRRVPSDLVVFAPECTVDIRAMIENGRRVKGCVDRNHTGAGELAVTVVGKLAAGVTLPNVYNVMLGTFDKGAD